MTMTSASYPLAPTTTARKGTLLDAASVSTSYAWMDGLDLFHTFNCMKFQSAANLCGTTAKTFGNAINWTDGIRFAAYGGVQCRAVGLDQAEMKSQVEKVFNEGESTAVERALMAQRFVLNADTTYLSAPTMTAPSTSTTGGTLAAGTYRAVLTATTAFGETTVSNEVSQATTGATSRIIWNWNDLTGETGYRLYVTAVGGGAGTETWLIDLAAGTTTYNWTGTPARGTATPPTSNTAAINASPGEWPAPTDITPAAGAVKPGVGLAMLEGYAADNYVGAPTLHVPVTIASLILGVDGAAYDGRVLRTKMGSKIAAGAGYDFPNTGPTGAAAATGEKWLYATGEVVVGRGPVQIVQSTDPVNNDVFVLAERPYIAAVDCFAAAIRVGVSL